MSGTYDEHAGQAKERLGEAIGDEELEKEGKQQEATGKMKEAIDSAADKLKEGADSLRNRMGR